MARGHGERPLRQLAREDLFRHNCAHSQYFSILFVQLVSRIHFAFSSINFIDKMSKSDSNFDVLLICVLFKDVETHYNSNFLDLLRFCNWVMLLNNL